jgi:TRAP-type mannitol/chloroaromatic compound transport system permease small subunit
MCREKKNYVFLSKNFFLIPNVCVELMDLQVKLQKILKEETSNRSFLLSKFPIKQMLKQFFFLFYNILNSPTVVF